MLFTKRQKFLLCALSTLLGASLYLKAEEIKVSEETHYFLPTTEAEGRYFYVFGPEAAPGLGAKDCLQVAFFRFRANLGREITISAFDPDTSGGHDAMTFNKATVTQFLVYGGAGAFTDENSRSQFPKAEQAGKILASQVFIKEFDNEWYHFGPFQPSDGEIVGEWSYFKVVVQGVKGGWANYFRLAATPKNACDGFCYTTSLHLKQMPGTVTQFHVEVPKGMTRLVEMNYDVDASGGTVYFDTPKRSFKLAPSASGKWVRNEIELAPEETGARCVYRFVKGLQTRTNMTFTFTDAEGRPLRVFSAPGVVDALPVIAAIKVEVPSDADPCLTFVFDASKSSDPDNENLTYEWDFGDGSPKSDQIKVVHSYEKPGKYTVKLTVNDGSKADCAVSQTTQEVVANTKPAPAADTPQFLITKQSGTFDASMSTDTPGDVLSFAWEFGDGEKAEGAKVEYAYAKGGDYHVKLTVRDDKNTRCSVATLERLVRVNTPPVADAGPDVTISEALPLTPFKVLFDGSKSYDPDGHKLTYQWDFGDNTPTALGEKVEHVYAKGSEYTVTLTVRDNSGLPGDTDTDEAKVNLNRAPTALLECASVGCMDEEMVFSAARSLDLDEDPITYLWDFGDGTQGAGLTPRHAYPKPGAYTVKLVADDGRKTNVSQHSVTRSIRILEPIVAIIKPIQSAPVGEPILFEADAEKNPKDRNLTYLWDLGNETKIESTSTRFTFKQGGAYKVKLVVEDGSGLKCGRSEAEALVRVNSTPIASLEILNKICCIDQEVKFDASKSKDPDGDELKYLWDFGDGETSTEAAPVHVYRKAGVFKVTLTVTDVSGLPGAAAVATAVARVNRAPIAIIAIDNP